LVIIAVKTDEEKVLLQSKDSQNKYSRDLEKRKDPEEAVSGLNRGFELGISDAKIR
jgi:hypothetical protein